MAFQTMPYLFGKWGTALATTAGFMWFGLLFFAGITSSLAMGTPWMGFMQDEYGYSTKKAAWTFGLVTLIMGLPTVIFFQQGVFDQYDYWAGTVGLVVFALAETILFSWIFDIHNGWNEIKEGADIRLPKIYKPIIRFVTPSILAIIFVLSLVSPKDNDWKKAINEKWEFDAGSILGQIGNVDIAYNRSPIASELQADNSGNISFKDGKMVIVDESGSSLNTYELNGAQTAMVGEGDSVKAGQSIAIGRFINPIFYRYLARLMLLGLFIYIGLLVRNAHYKKKGATA
jgi:hypothetical protein